MYDKMKYTDSIEIHSNTQGRKYSILDKVDLIGVQSASELKHQRTLENGAKRAKFKRD